MEQLRELLLEGIFSRKGILQSVDASGAVAQLVRATDS